MGGWRPAPIVGGCYKDDTRPSSAQDCVNYIYVKADVPGGRSASLLRGLPGLTAFGTATGTPVRGLRNVEGNLYAVRGNDLSQVAVDGTATSLGPISGVGLVSMTDNEISGGHQLAIGTGPSGFVYNTVTNALVPITDPGFPGTPIFEFIDNYVIGMDPLGKFWFESDLANALSYNTMDRQEAESAPDDIVTLIVNHSEVWVMGGRTIDPFIDNGTATGTFVRAPGIVIEQGCAARFSAVVLDNAVFWLGNDGIVYKSNGYTPVRKSTHAIEQEIRDLDWSQAFAFTWTDGGHKVYYLTFPDGHTWGYDCATDLWHRRESYRLHRWRISALVFWNGVWIAGDYETGQLYKLDWDNYTENGEDLVAERTTGVLSNNGDTIINSGFALTMDTGRGAINADHVVEFCYSDDGGYNFKAWKTRQLGPRGAYGKRIEFLRLGSTRQRVGRVRVSSPCKRDIISAQVKVDGTES